MKDLSVSIIIPVLNEENYIISCLSSIYQQDYPSEHIEIIVIDGGSTDNTVSVIKNKFPRVRILSNPKKIVPISLNIGIKAACGDYIIRLDAHASYNYNYISTLIRYQQEYQADNVGAVCKTEVLNKTPTSCAIKEVLTHPLGVGNSQFRIGINKITPTDTVPFGCWEKESFSKFGLFDERLVRNQDIEFNKRIKKAGGTIILVPETFCTYYAREYFSSFAKSNYGNGLWNILTVYYTKTWKSLSFRHFIPLLFVSSLIFPIFGGLFYHPLFYISLISLLSYLICLLFVSLSLKKKSKDSLCLLLILWAFITLHIPYGCGSLMGFLKIIRLKIQKKKCG